MNQQINFLRHLPTPANEFSVKRMVIIAGACFAVLLLISLFIFADMYYLGGEVDRATHEKADAQVSYQEAVQKFPILSNPKPLGKRVLEMEKTLAAKKQYFSKLIHASSRLGFSSYLLSLSKITPDGLWLNKIMIDQGNNHVVFHGLTLQPDTVPLFLQGLQNSPVFNKIPLDLFYLKKIADKNYISFEVANLIVCNKNDGAGTCQGYVHS